MSFFEDLDNRFASAYADFLLPHLKRDAILLDCGCGSGSITVGLAPSVGLALGLDLHDATVRPAMAYAGKLPIPNARFLAGNASSLPFADGVFDAVLLHSVLETVEEPSAFLLEARRVLAPGGVVAAASVEYSGLILAGPNEQLLRRFYSVREQLWTIERLARPRAGRELRRLVGEAGFSNIQATARYFSYGTPEAVRQFAEARAAECSDAWFDRNCLDHGLLSEVELHRVKLAWQEWGSSPESFAAFAWCRALGWKP